MKEIKVLEIIENNVSWDKEDGKVFTTGEREAAEEIMDYYNDSVDEEKALSDHRLGTIKILGFALFFIALSIPIIAFFLTKKIILISLLIPIILVFVFCKYILVE